MRATLIRVVNADPDLLRHLSNIGLTPGTEIKILDFSPYDGNLTIEKNPEEPPVVLGPSITKTLLVEFIPA